MRRAEAHRQLLGSLWHNRGLRWGGAVAVLLGGSLLAMFGLMYWRSSALLFETLDRSALEQLELLSARPPELLPFMISSRMTRQPEVVTKVGLFTSDRRPLVGDIAVIPHGLRLDGRVRPVLSPGGRSADAPSADAPAPEALPSGVPPGAPVEHWRSVGRVLPNRQILVVARNADEILQVRQNLVNGAVVGIIPAILLSLAGGAWAGLATERRLRRLNLAAERIIAGDLAERLTARPTGDELDRLCAIVNRILDRLEEGVAALRGVGEDIAHDIRTPLTALRARLERTAALVGADSPAGAAIGQSIQNVDQALSIVSALLRISDIEHVRRAAAFAPLALAEIVTETADSFQPVAEEKGIAFAAICDTQAEIVGDRQLLIEALVNLVDNAVKFTPQGGQVELRLCGTPGAPLLIVSDTGPGISPHGRAHAFERFYREDGARSTKGSGLGLSLVAAVARLHRFAVSVDDNRPGCRITLRCWRDSDPDPAPAPAAT